LMLLPRALRSRLLVLVLLAFACGACSTWPRGATRNAPEFPPQAAPAAPRRATASNSDPGDLLEARQQLAQAEALVEQTRSLVAGWTGADADLVQARGASAQGEAAEVRVYAREALARAEEALSDHYARMANAELARSYTFSGLDDGQLLQLRAAEEILVTGNSRLAYGRLRELNRQLEKRIRTYTVRSGDSLWVIAGRPEVYANSLLWPLIWQANVTVIPNPDRLRRGQVLKVRPHPNVDEIADAVDTARGERKKKPEPGTTPRIGDIREAGE
ncbi:MAG: LysM peptidoglycan-binding domain-containing protein, partial [Panacagrimonas sp.]